MVSQVNRFKDDVSGELFETPAEAIESERLSCVARYDFFAALAWRG